MKTPPFISWRTELPAILLLGVNAMASAFFDGWLPERVPTHWNWAGEIDGWGSRTFVVIFFPLLSLGIYLLLLSIWRLDPRRDRYVEFAKSYHSIKTMTLAFLTGLFIVVGFNGADLTVLGTAITMPMATVMPALLGTLFVGIGANLADIKQNWFFGIRTPWTLSSEKVWARTHRLAAYLFVFGGATVALSAFVPGVGGFITLLAALLLAALIPVVYSYILFRFEQGAKQT